MALSTPKILGETGAPDPTENGGSDSGGSAGETFADILAENEEFMNELGLGVGPNEAITGRGRLAEEVGLGVFQGLFEAIGEGLVALSEGPLGAIANFFEQHGLHELPGHLQGPGTVTTSFGQRSIYIDNNQPQYPAGITVEEMEEIDRTLRENPDAFEPDPDFRDNPAFQAPRVIDPDPNQAPNQMGIGAGIGNVVNAIAGFLGLTDQPAPATAGALGELGDSRFGGREIPLGYNSWTFNVPATGPIGSGDLASRPGILGGLGTVADVLLADIPARELLQRGLLEQDRQGEFNTHTNQARGEIATRMAQEGLTADDPRDADRINEIENDVWSNHLGEAFATGQVDPDNVSGLIGGPDRLNDLLGGGDVPSIGPGAGLDLGDYEVINASYLNRPNGQPVGTIFASDSGVFIGAPGGEVELASDVLAGVGRLVANGGTPSATEMAMIQTMTPQQRAAAGIFLRQDGTVVSTSQVIYNALVNISNGQPLTQNQQVAIGNLFLRIPDDGELSEQLRIMTGMTTGGERNIIGDIFRESIGAAQENNTTAIEQTHLQTLIGMGLRNPQGAIDRLEAAGATDGSAALVAMIQAGVDNPVRAFEEAAADGRRNPAQFLINQEERRNTNQIASDLVSAVGADRTYTTAGGEVVSVEDLARRAANNIRHGRPLTPLQQQLITDAEIAETARPILRTLGDTTFTTRGGRTVSANFAIQGALANIEAGRPLTMVQRQALAAYRDETGIIVPGAPAGRLPPPAALDTRLGRRVVNALGADETYTTLGGRTVTVQHAVQNALSNLQNGRPLTALQREVLQDYRRETGVNLIRQINQLQGALDRAGIEDAGDRLAALRDAGRTQRGAVRTLLRQQGRAQQEVVQRTREAAQAAIARRQQTFTTRTGATRTLQEVLQAARANQTAGQRLTQNQRIAVRQQRQETTRRLEAARARTNLAQTNLELARLGRRQTFPGAGDTTRTMQQVLARARANQAAGRPLTENQQTAVRQQQAVRRARLEVQRGQSAIAARTVAQLRQDRQRAFTTPAGRTLSVQQMLARARANQQAGRPLSANQATALAQQREFQRARLTAAQTRATVEATEARQRQQNRTRVFTTSTGDTRTLRQVLDAARRNQAAGRPLSANQQQALREQQMIGQSRLQASQAAAEAERREAAMAARERTRTFTTRTGETVDRATVLARAQANQAAGRPLTANQQQVLREQQNVQQQRLEAAQAEVTAARQEARLIQQGRTRAFTTRTGGSVDRATVLARAQLRAAEGRQLTANQQQVLREQQQILLARQAASREAAEAARLELRQARGDRTRVFQTRSGEDVSLATVLARAQRNQAAGRFLTANQRAALAEQARIDALQREVQQNRARVRRQGERAEAAGAALTAPAPRPTGPLRASAAQLAAIQQAMPAPKPRPTGPLQASAAQLAAIQQATRPKPTATRPVGPLRATPAQLAAIEQATGRPKPRPVGPLQASAAQLAAIQQATRAKPATAARPTKPAIATQAQLAAIQQATRARPKPATAAQAQQQIARPKPLTASPAQLAAIQQATRPKPATATQAREQIALPRPVAIQQRPLPTPKPEALPRPVPKPPRVPDRPLPPPPRPVPKPVPAPVPAPVPKPPRVPPRPTPPPPPRPVPPRPPKPLPVPPKPVPKPVPVPVPKPKPPGATAQQIAAAVGNLQVQNVGGVAKVAQNALAALKAGKPLTAAQKKVINAFKKAGGQV